MESNQDFLLCENNPVSLISDYYSKDHVVWEIYQWQLAFSPKTQYYTKDDIDKISKETNEKFDQVCASIKSNIYAIYHDSLLKILKSNPIYQTDMLYSTTTFRELLESDKLKEEFQLLKSIAKEEWNGVLMFRDPKDQKYHRKNEIFRPLIENGIFFSKQLCEDSNKELSAIVKFVCDMKPRVFGNSSDFSAKTKYVYQPWMEKYTKYVGRNTRKRYKLLQYITSSPITTTMEDAVIDHKFFQVLDLNKEKLESITLENLNKIITSKKPKKGAEFYQKNDKIFEDLKHLFLFCRFMDWFPTLPVSIDRPIDYETLFSQKFCAFDFWRSKHAASFDHWNKQWENNVIKNFKKDSDWDQGRTVEFDAFSDPRKKYRLFISGFHIISMFVSYFHTLESEMFWPMMQSIHNWLIRPRLQKNSSETISATHRYWIAFPKYIGKTYPREEAKWNRNLTKKLIGDVLMDILDRYGHFNINCEIESENPFFDLIKMYKFKQPNLFSANQEVSIRVPQYNISEKEAEVDTSVKLINRKQRLFSKWISDRTQIESIGTAYTLLLYSLYGKFFPTLSGSPYVYQLKSQDSTLSYFGQYQYLANHQLTINPKSPFNTTKLFEAPYLILIYPLAAYHLMWTEICFGDKYITNRFQIPIEKLKAIDNLIMNIHSKVRESFVNMIYVLKDSPANFSWLVSRFLSFDLCDQVYINHYLQYPTCVPIENKNIADFIEEIWKTTQLKTCQESIDNGDVSENRINQYKESLENEVKSLIDEKTQAIIGKDDLRILFGNLDYF